SGDQVLMPDQVGIPSRSKVTAILSLPIPARHILYIRFIRRTRSGIGRIFCGGPCLPRSGAVIQDGSRAFIASAGWTLERCAQPALAKSLARSDFSLFM